jgi:hypothetical protein
MTGFLGSTILEVAMGITFVYLVMALLCSTVNEWIAGLLNARATNLRDAIGGLLNDQKLASGKDFLEAFYTHPIVTGLMQNNRHPSYMPSRAFALTVMDLAAPQVEGPATFSDLENGIKSLPPGDVRTALLALLQNTQGNFSRAQLNLEGWFDDAMDRASGWYRRRTQVWTILIAVVVTIAINADTITIARSLWTAPTLRGAIIAKAASLPANASEINELGQLMGWTAAIAANLDPWVWLMRVVGWILTITAVSMGAPFWFDVLNKFVNLRNAGRSPSESSKPPEKPIAPPADKLA